MDAGRRDQGGLMITEALPSTRLVRMDCTASRRREVGLRLAARDLSSERAASMYSPSDSGSRRSGKGPDQASPGASCYVATVTQMLPKAATMRSGE